MSASGIRGTEELVENELRNVEDLIRQIWERRTDRYSEERLTNIAKTNERKIEMSYIGG